MEVCAWLKLVLATDVFAEQLSQALTAKQGIAAPILTVR